MKKFLLLAVLITAVFSQITTVTKTVNIAPTDCPVCFNCNDTPCSHYADCVGNQCKCPGGFGGETCLEPTCDSPNIDPLLRTVREPNQQCTCTDGFEGINCNACTKDDVCKPKAGSPVGSSVVCNTGTKVWLAGSTYCTSDEPLLRSIYNGTTIISMNRNITSGSMLASLWYQNIEQFYCQMNGCTQKIVDGGYVWGCQQTKCSCIANTDFCGGPTSKMDLSSQINKLANSFSFKCPTETSHDNCVMEFQSFNAFFPNGLRLGTCFSGECANPDDQPADDRYQSLNEMSPAAIIGISISSLILAAGLLGILLGLLKRRQLLKSVVPAPRSGVSIKFKGIGYSVKEKQILGNLSGYAGAGRVLAILGPSGAGKSTFLDILAGKSKSGVVRGTILVDGKKMDPRSFKKMSGFVDQEDILLDSLTVRETLLFSAELRLPESVSSVEKGRIVEQTIRSLGLSHVANSRIGGNGIRGISGGEKRRVSIGVELVTSPSVLFLDEPTSGLDSYNAFMVVQTLASLASQGGKTIIFTIHQPRSDVYQLFDDVLVLTKGSILYMGEGKRADEYMAGRGFSCPSNYNIADHLLDVAITAAPTAAPNVALNIDSPDSQIRNRKQMEYNLGNPITPDDPNSIHLQDLRHNNITNDNQEEKFPQNSSLSSGTLSDGPRQHPESTTELVLPAPTEDFQVSWLTQLNKLSGRSFKMLYRKPSLLAGHLIISVILGVFVGLLYFKSQNTLAGFQNRLGSVFFILTLIGFSSLSAIGTFTSERLLFLRERSNGFYGPIPFYLSRVFFDIIPLRLVPTLLMGTISFYMIGYIDDLAYFTRFIIILFLFSSISGLFCLAIGCLFDDYSTAILVASISMLFQMLMAGILINAKDIPIFLRWIQYLSFYKYAYEAVVVNVVGSRINDDIGGMAVDIPTSIILQQFGFDVGSYWSNFIILLFINVGFLLVLLLLIIFRLKERR